VTIDPAFASPTESTARTSIDPGRQRVEREPVAEVGTCIGRYVVVGVIGEGGMGRVMRAYDGKLRREVALKLLHGTHDDTAGARIVREAQAMARLSHPNIVAVYDVDVHEGRPFIAMELVEGQTVQTWLATRPDAAEVLDAFVAVGRGVAAAHAAGLVHRDLKLANLLRGDDGRVRVTDFGIARSVDDATPSLDRADGPAVADDLLTRAGTVIGTPPYMAPEQHEGKPADARSDQYAFCVALWEGLAGERPFDAADVDRLLAAKRAMRLRGGARLSGSVRLALMRGLAPRPDDRFASMVELLEVLTQGKTRRRRRRIAIALGGVATAAVLLVAQRGWKHQQQVRACGDVGARIERTWGAETRERLRATFLATGAPYAATTAEKVLPRLDAHADAWREAATEACLDAKVRAAWDEPTYVRAQLCLEQRETELQSMIEELERGGTRAAERAVMAIASLVEVDACRDRDLLARQPMPPDDPDEAIRSVRRLISRAEAMRAAGDYAESVAVAKAALERARALQWPPLVAAGGHAFGRALDRAGDGDEAELELEQAYFIAAAAGAAELAGDIAESLAFTVGVQLLRFDDGLRWSKHAEVLHAAIPDPGRSREARHLHLRAALLSRLGQHAEAIEIGERELALLGEAIGEEHPEMATSLDSVANVYAAAGQYDQAERYHRRALALREHVLGPDHPDVARALSNLANTVEIRGGYDDAEALLVRALAIRERVFGADHPTTASSLNNLANVYASTGAFDRAAVLYERCVAIAETSAGPQSVAYASALANLGTLHAQIGEYEVAQQELAQSLAIRERVLGTGHPDVARSLNAIGWVELELDRLDEAREALRRALAIQDDALPDDHPDLAATLNNLGTLERRVGALDDAWALHERALAIRERALGSLHPKLAHALIGLAEVALARGRSSEAVVFAERALGVRTRGQAAPFAVAEAQFLLARALWDAGSDRGRASTLAQQARAAVESLRGAAPAKTLAEIDRWLATR
jgi:serine/threonine protein kinase/Tfp pilus assembly protein PilF